MSPAAWLRGLLRSHNRQAVGLALLSFAAAALAWNLAWFFFALLLLGFTTAIHGDIGTQMPAWIPGSALALVVLLLLWGVIDQKHRRYAGVSDRQILGWHLLSDLLLLPVRLTFAVWGNLSAVQRLSDGELARAWELLVTIRRDGKAHLRSLALIEPDTDALFRLTTALQMLGLVDLHRGEGEWFYTMRSSQWQRMGQLLETPAENP